MVVHIFAVQNSVIWIGNTTINQGAMQWNTVETISYNTHVKRGVLISQVTNDPATNDLIQMVTVFDALDVAPFVSERASVNFSVTGEPVLGSRKGLK